MANNAIKKLTVCNQKDSAKINYIPDSNKTTMIL